MSKRMVDLKVEDGKIASIDGHEVGGGTAVEANPQEQATQQLDKIKIDNVAYNIAGGSGAVNIVAETSASGVIKEGRITNKQWLGDRKLLPNTSYEVGDNVKIYFTKKFDTKTLQANQIIGIMHCFLNFNSDVKLQYGGVVLVPTIADIRPSCTFSNNNFSLSAGCYMTFTIVQGGTTGSDVTLPADSAFDAGVEYIVHTLTTA